MVMAEKGHFLGQMPHYTQCQESENAAPRRFQRSNDTYANAERLGQEGDSRIGRHFDAQLTAAHHRTALFAVFDVGTTLHAEQSEDTTYHSCLHFFGLHWRESSGVSDRARPCSRGTFATEKTDLIAIDNSDPGREGISKEPV